MLTALNRACKADRLSKLRTHFDETKQKTNDLRLR
jgi:hypothetical protein